MRKFDDIKNGNKEIVRAILTAFPLMILACITLLLCEWQGTFADTIYKCRKLFWSMPFFSILISICYYCVGRGLDDRTYVNKLLPMTGRLGKDRKVYLDYARVLAAIMVILTHACSNQMGENVEIWKNNLLVICAAVGLVCNPLYVMISGTLLLSSKKEENIGSFYYRRFIKVLLPMVVYYAIFLCMSGQMSFIPLQNVGSGFKQILAGVSDVVPHYRLIYTIISLYLVAPFIRVMVQNLTQAQITALFFLILGEEIVITFLPLTGMTIGFSLNLAGWEGVFILGYIITERRNRIIERTVLIVGVISAIVVPLVLLHDFSLTGYVCNTAPVMVMFAAVILLLLSKVNHYLQNKKDGVIQILAKYSYAIILVHWVGLFAFTYGKIGFQPLRFGCIGGIIITVLTALLVCFVLGFLADNTIIFVLQYLFERAGEFVNALIRRKISDEKRI